MVRAGEQSLGREEMRVYRAPAEEAECAFAIIEEYNSAVGVEVRDAWPEFRAMYFGQGSGVWLARLGECTVGCIALRPLADLDRSGEVKRLYVRPEFRSRGLADALLAELERYARDAGYGMLYLDSKDDLQAALRFYARHGYEPCARYNRNPQATVFLRKRMVES